MSSSSVCSPFSDANLSVQKTLPHCEPDSWLIPMGEDTVTPTAEELADAAYHRRIAAIVHELWLEALVEGL